MNIDDIEVVVQKPEEQNVGIREQLRQSALSTLKAQYDPTNKQWGVYLKEGTLSQNALTLEELSNLAKTVPQSTLKSIITINDHVRYYINLDDLFGKTYEAIETNTNTEFKLEYRDFSEQRNKLKTLEKAKVIIDDFNRQIKIRDLIRKVIPLTFAEGNYVMYLRKNKEN